jgi:hypothetical protein
MMQEGRILNAVPARRSIDQTGVCQKWHFACVNTRIRQLCRIKQAKNGKLLFTVHLSFYTRINGQTLPDVPKPLAPLFAPFLHAVYHNEEPNYWHRGDHHHVSRVQVPLHKIPISTPPSRPETMAYIGQHPRPPTQRHPRVPALAQAQRLVRTDQLRQSPRPHHRSDTRQRCRARRVDQEFLQVRKPPNLRVRDKPVWLWPAVCASPI